MIWFWYGNSLFKFFFTFYFQPSTFIMQMFDYYALQVDHLIFQTVNALWTMDFSNLPSESWLVTLSQHSFVSGVIIMGHNKIQISIGLFQKKSPQVGLRIWNFQGYQWLWLALSPFLHDESSITNREGGGGKKVQQHCQKNNVASSGVLFLEFPRHLAQFCGGISRGWALFCLRFGLKY